MAAFSDFCVASVEGKVLENICQTAVRRNYIALFLILVYIYVALERSINISVQIKIGRIFDL